MIHDTSHAACPPLLEDFFFGWNCWKIWTYILLFTEVIRRKVRELKGVALAVCTMGVATGYWVDGCGPNGQLALDQSNSMCRWLTGWRLLSADWPNANGLLQCFASASGRLALCFSGLAFSVGYVTCVAIGTLHCRVQTTEPVGCSQLAVAALHYKFTTKLTNVDSTLVISQYLIDTTLDSTNNLIR